MGKILNKIFENKGIIIFSLIMFVAYLSTLSCSFDDEDSILFINGVNDFDVTDYRPHPPGYPIYIFFGKISTFFIQDEVLALTILSAIFGALSLVVFYFLISKMFDKRVGLMSTMIMGVTPLFWLNSLKAMTDMTALFFILLSMYFIYSFIKENKVRNLYIGSFVSALTLGVRIHAFFIVIPLLIYSYFKLKDEKKIFYSLIFFLFGALVWVVPVAIDVGFWNYVDAFLRQFFSRFSNPDQATVGGEFTVSYLLLRIKSFLGFFLTVGYGIRLWNFNIGYVVSLFVYLFFFVLIYGAIESKRTFEGIKDKGVFFFLVGLVFYVIAVFLFLPAHNPRYLLPLIPFFSLLFGLGVSLFGKYEYLAFGVLFVLLFGYSIPLVGDVHDIPSAPAQAVYYIKDNYDIDNVSLFINGVNRGFFTYYDVEYRGRESLKIEMDNEALRENKTILFVVTNPEHVEGYNASLIKKFERDYRVHMKQSIVFLYEVVGRLE